MLRVFRPLKCRFLSASGSSALAPGSFVSGLEMRSGSCSGALAMERFSVWIAVSAGLLCACAALPASAPGAELCEGLDPELCAEITAASEDKGPSPVVRGIIVDRVGNRTQFKVPLGYTHGADYERLLDETVQKFTRAVGELNQRLKQSGVDLPFLDGSQQDEFNREYVDIIRRTLDIDVHAQMDRELGEAYARPRELSTWRRYLTPQAYVGYFGTKFSANLGVGGGVSATILIVAQPWLVLEVDHTAAEPRVVSKTTEVDLAVLGVPNLDIGFGAGGGGPPFRFGVGAIFGPLNEASGIAGWGVGVSGGFGIPIAGGGNAKFVTLLQVPPLFMAQIGYTSGTVLKWEVHGNVQYVMDIEEFVAWLSGSSTPAPNRDLRPPAPKDPEPFGDPLPG